MLQKPRKTKEQYHRFWKHLAKYLEDNGSRLLINNPKAKGHYEIPISRGSVYIKLIITSKVTEEEDNKNKRVEIYLGNNKYVEDFFNRLKKDELEIKDELGIDIVFDGSQSHRCKRGRFEYKEFFDVWDEKTWDKECKWFKETAEVFYTVFKPRLDTIAQELGLG